MPTRRWPIFKLLGFQVWVDWSWFILALLITWSLAGYFDDGQRADATRWIMGAAGAIGVFVSIVLHELGHSVVARRYGMQMRGITLFIFGGVAEMTDEPPSAAAEFFVAIAGPIVSVVIGSALLSTTLLGVRFGLPATVTGVTGWLGWINLVLVVFNLVPAFPLDGGRVLRAVLWQWKSDLRWATRVTAGIGGMFGIALIALGVMSFFFGNFVGGIWWVVLGLFLRAAAVNSYQQVLIRRALEGETVARFMTPSPVVVPADITIRDLIDGYFYQHYHKMYPVADDGRLRGCVSIGAVKSVPRDQWEERTVGEIADECDDMNTVRSTDDALQAMAKLSRSGASRLLVVDDGRLVGILSLKDLMRFLSLRTELQDAP